MIADSDYSCGSKHFGLGTSEKQGALETSAQALQARDRATKLVSRRPGTAAAGLLDHWEPLAAHLHYSQTRLDNNPMGNAFRPSGIGKKNWLFVGDPDAGQRSGHPLPNRRLLSAPSQGPLRLYGRGAGGERCLGKMPQGHWQTSTFIASLRFDRIDTPFLIEGSANMEVFAAYVDHVLCPDLNAGDVVLLDNLCIHKTATVARLIEARGATVNYPAALAPSVVTVTITMVLCRIVTITTCPMRSSVGRVSTSTALFQNFTDTT